MRRRLALLAWGAVAGCAQALIASSSHRFLSASSSEGLLGSTLCPEVAVPWSRGG